MAKPYPKAITTKDRNNGETIHSQNSLQNNWRWVIDKRRENIPKKIGKKRKKTFSNRFWCVSFHSFVSLPLVSQWCRPLTDFIRKFVRNNNYKKSITSAILRIMHLKLWPIFVPWWWSGLTKTILRTIQEDFKLF